MQQPRNRALSGKAPHRCLLPGICIFQTKADSLPPFFRCIMLWMQKEKNIMKENCSAGLEKVFYIRPIFYPATDYNGRLLMQTPQNSRCITRNFPYFLKLHLTTWVK